MSIIGDIVGSVAKAVLPVMLDAVAPAAMTMPTHHDAQVPRATDAVAAATDPVSKFVAMNGLHGIAPR
jgi:hypothetical protein